MSSIFAVLFVAWIGYAAHSDWRDRRVTNTWITLGLLGAVALTVIGTSARAFFPAADRLDCVIGFIFGFMVLLPAFALGAVGASDVKFLAVLGAVTGFHPLLWTWIIASLLAMLHAMVYALAISRSHHGSVLRVAGIAAQPQRGIPYVTYLAAGGLATTLFGFLSHQTLGLP